MKKYKLIGVGLLTFVILGGTASFATFSHINSKEQTSKNLTTGSLSVTNNPNGQIIGVSSSNNLPSICIDSCDQTQAENSQTPSSPVGNNSSTNNTPRQATGSMTDHWWDQYLSTPTQASSMPDFDYGRPSPTLNVPPNPNCGSTSDSSYYADCIDNYCRSYPDTNVCLSRQ